MIQLSILKKVPNLLLVFSVCAALYGATQSYRAPSGFEYIWVLPLLYSFLLIITNIQKNFFGYLGLSILNIILFVRYVLIPLFSAVTGLYGHSKIPFEGSFVNKMTVYLLGYEMICLFLVLHIGIKKLNKVHIKKGENFLTTKKNNVFFLFFVILGVFSFILFPAIRERMNFLIVNEFEFINLNTLSSFGFLLSDNAPKLFFLWVVSREYKKKLNGKKTNELFIFLIAFLSISIVSSNSRLTILAQGLATIFLLKKTNLVPPRSLNIIGIITIIVIFSLTSLRLFGVGSLESFDKNATAYFDLQMVSDYLQSYFGGHHLISAAITLSTDFNGEISEFLNEAISSIMFVRQIFPLGDFSSTVHFNKLFGYYAGNSMILPTLGQSYMYFGFLGAPLVPVLLCIFLLFIESKLLQARDIGLRFSFLLLSVWLAFFPMQNINIVSATFFNTFFPLYLFVWINKKLNLKRVERATRNNRRQILHSNNR